MNALRRALPSTPRLAVVGLIIFGMACHRQAAPPAKPTPAPQPAPARPVPAAPAAIVSGPTLVQAMHDRYSGKWYHTLTFVQRTTIALQSGGEVKQTWYEAGSLPGKLRIDTDISAKHGTLYSG